MAVTERHPLDFVEIDAVFVTQNAANPQRGGLCVRANTDLPAFDIFRIEMAEVEVVARAVMLEAARDRRRQQHIRLAVRLRLQERDNREFARVEPVFAHHRLEAVVRRRRPTEVEVDDVRAHAAIFHCLRDGIVGQVRAQRRHASKGRCH
jgi:hypothetical protein